MTSNESLFFLFGLILFPYSSFFKLQNWQKENDLIKMFLLNEREKKQKNFHMHYDLLKY